MQSDTWSSWSLLTLKVTCWPTSFHWAPGGPLRIRFTFDSSTFTVISLQVQSLRGDNKNFRRNAYSDEVWDELLRFGHLVSKPSGMLMMWSLSWDCRRQDLTAFSSVMTIMDSLREGNCWLRWQLGVDGLPESTAGRIIISTLIITSHFVSLVHKQWPLVFVLGAWMWTFSPSEVDAFQIVDCGEGWNSSELLCCPWDQLAVLSSRNSPRLLLS